MDLCYYEEMEMEMVQGLKRSALQSLSQEDLNLTTKKRPKKIKNRIRVPAAAAVVPALAKRAPPVIIHTFPPPVIKADPRDFMWIVQSLTGSSETKTRCSASKTKPATTPPLPPPPPQQQQQQQQQEKEEEEQQENRLLSPQPLLLPELDSFACDYIGFLYPSAPPSSEEAADLVSTSVSLSNYNRLSPSVSTGCCSLGGGDDEDVDQILFGDLLDEIELLERSSSISSSYSSSSSSSSSSNSPFISQPHHWPEVPLMVDW